MKRAIDIGPVDAAVTKTAGGKVRLRLLFTEEQLAMLLDAARDGDVEGDDEDVAAKPAPEPAADPAKRVFVREGTPAWDAWVTYRRRDKPDWYITTQHLEGGRTLTGWWFPSLFPPHNHQP